MITRHPFEKAEEEKAAMVGWINHLKKEDPTSRLGVHRGGWSSDKSLFETGPWPDLVHHIFKRVYLVKGWDEDYLLRPSESVQVCAWANVMEKGERVLAHHHIKSHHGGLNCLAGIYYVSSPEGSAPIIFRPDGPYPSGSPRVPIAGRDETSEVYAPEEGVLFLFPPDLIHMVPVHQLDEPRISLGINIRKSVDKPKLEHNKEEK